jgi:hypothetical protein
MKINDEIIKVIRDACLEGDLHVQVKHGPV